LWSFGIFFPALVFCTKKNLATLLVTLHPKSSMRIVLFCRLESPRTKSNKDFIGEVKKWNGQFFFKTLTKLKTIFQTTAYQGCQIFPATAYQKGRKYTK
jgi:hypothetical protein